MRKKEIREEPKPAYKCFWQEVYEDHSQLTSVQDFQFL